MMARSYTNPYPIHDYLLKPYPGKPSDGLANIKQYLQNAKTNLASKLHLLGRLLETPGAGKVEERAHKVLERG